MSINNYIIEFEKLNLKLKEHKIDLADAVLEYRLLNNANIGHEREQLAGAILAKLTYSNMKDQLRKIFDETCLASPSPKLDHNIKIESDSSADVYYSNNRRQGTNRRIGRMNQKGGRGQQSKQYGGNARKRNPADAYFILPSVYFVNPSFIGQRTVRTGIKLKYHLTMRNPCMSHNLMKRLMTVTLNLFLMKLL